MAPKGELIATDQKLRLIDAATGEVGREVSQSDAGNASLRGVSFHPNGEYENVSSPEDIGRTVQTILANQKARRQAEAGIERRAKALAADDQALLGACAGDKKAAKAVRGSIKARKQLASGGAPPLHMAALVGHKAAVSELLAAGADMNAATPDGATPLYVAALNGHKEVVSALLAASAGPN